MTAEITRFDFVKQADGGWDWCVEVTRSAPDPLHDGETLTRSYGPLAPAQAKEQFGLDLADVLKAVDMAAILKCEALAANLQTEREAHAATHAAANAAAEEADRAHAAEVGEARAALDAEVAAHAETRAAIAE